MGRKPREISEMHTYHLILRGVAKNNIFTCDEDRNQFRSKLYRFAEELEIGLISYILMDNHVHLLVQEKTEGSCSVLVRKMCNSYVRHYFNPKYDRCGALFQHRFRSRAVNTKKDMLNVSKYIHQNALVQGLHDPLKNTSYGELLDAYDKKCGNKAIFVKPLEKMMTKRMFKDMVKECDKAVLMMEDYTLSDDQVRAYLCGALGIESVGFLHKADQVRRNFALKTLAENGITLKRLARITCLTKPELRQICFG